MRQVGVGKANRYALDRDDRLWVWTDDPAQAETVMKGVRSFAAGRSGLLIIHDDRSLWRHHTAPFLGLFGERLAESPRRVGTGAAATAVGDGTDYYVDTDGSLFVRGRADRGQYGDGRLSPTVEFVRTATDVVRIAAHTGHALILKRDGSVWGTGGNRHGPLGRHGYGDKAVRWGRILDDAVAIATGASHSVAIRRDGTLLAWGLNWGLEPRPVLAGASAVAAGTAIAVALADGALWEWGTGREPRRVMDCPEGSSER